MILSPAFSHCFRHCKLAAVKTAPNSTGDATSVKPAREERLSPDGKWLAYSVTTVDLAKNKKTSELWMQAIAGPNSGSVEAQKIAVVKEAEAEAEAKRLSGVGLAEQRKAIVAGLQSSVEMFRQGVPGLSNDDVMSLLLLNQYFDTLKDVARALGFSSPFHLSAQFHRLTGTTASEYMRRQRG